MVGSSVRPNGVHGPAVEEVCEREPEVDGGTADVGVVVEVTGG